MADRTWDEHSFSQPYEDQNPTRDGVSITDYPKAVVSGGAGLIGDLGSLVRSLGEAKTASDPDSHAGQAAEYLGKFTQNVFGDVEKYGMDSLSPAAKAKIQSTLTDPDFWSLNAMALKTANMSPAIAATVIPSIIFPGVGVAVASASVSGAAMSAGSVTDEIFKMTDALDDKGLQAQVPFYKNLRDQGVPEDQARKQYNEVVIGYRPLIAGAIGAITNSLGPAGQAARAVAGVGGSAIAEAGAGVAKRALSGAVEGAVAGGAQAGSTDYLIQEGAQEGGLQKDIDYGQVAETTASNAVVGGALGGGISAMHGGAKANSTDPLVGAALGDTNSTAPNQPGKGAPPEMSAPPSASGATATTGVPTAEVNGVAEAATSTPNIKPSEDGPTVAQQMQALKKFKVNYADLNPEQQAVVDKSTSKRGLPVKAGSKNVEVVETGAPDPAQDLALAAAKPPEAVAEPVAQPAPEAAPVPQSEPPVSAQPDVPVTPEGNPAPVEAVRPPETQVPEGVRPPEAPMAPEVQETAVRPPLPEPSPIAQAPAATAEPVRPTGPRVLDNLQAKPEADRIAAENAARVQDNIKGMEAPADEVVKGKNRTIAEQTQRQAVRDGTADIAKRFPPSDVEAGIYSKKPAAVTAARTVIHERAKTIAAEADNMGLVLPKKFKDNANAESNYNPETLLVLEAKRLAGIDKPSLADIKRFASRELDVRSGQHDLALSERRIEGDAAHSQTDGRGVETLTDAEVPADMADPETQLIAKQERERAEGTQRTKQPSQEVPASIDTALDDAMGVYGAARSKPEVETRKKRTFVRPDKQPVAETPAAKLKRDEIMARIASKRAKPEETTAPKATEVLPRKVTEVKDRVEAARQKTEVNPTDAQKEAGNYKKGTVSIHGMEIAIENPKGSTRTGIDKEGTQWATKMRHDYGYVKGTKGADGDAVDVHIGPDHDAPYVYVVDQKHLDTGAFDEHKAMVGFESQTAAREAYRKAYTDGKGADRILDMRKMSIPEFKEWVKKNPTERAGMSEQEAKDLSQVLLSTELEDRLRFEAAGGKLRDGFFMDPLTKRIARPISSHKVADLFADTHFKDLSGAPRAIAGAMKNHLDKLAGDVDVHIMTPENMARLAGRSVENAPYGYHVHLDDKDAIVIRSDLLQDRAKFRHTLMHEVVHAATVREIGTNRKLHTTISRLMGHVQLAADALPDADKATLRYGLTQPKEFIAEAMSNPRMQELMSAMPVTEGVAKFLNIDDFSVRSMWDALIFTVRKAMGFPKMSTSMLDAAIRVSEMSMKTREAAVEAGTHTQRSFLENGDPGFIRKGVQDVRDMIENRPDLAPTKGKPYLLGLRTWDNIARAADRYFPEGNPVRKLANYIEGQRVAAIHEVERAAPTIQKLKDLETKYKGKVWKDFSSLVHDETMAGVFADRPLSDQGHISKAGAADSWARAQYPELKARHDALPDDLKAARKEAMEFFTAKQNEMAQKLIRNRIVTLFDTPDPEGMATRIHEGTVTDADKAIMGDAYDAIAAAGVLSKIKGPYVPLMRRGNFVVHGTRKVTSPGNAKEISANEFEFRDKDAAAKWAASQDGRPTMRTVYVDKNTGSMMGMENGKEVRLTANDMDAVPAYRVVVQDRHMEMFDTMKEARARVAELRGVGMDVADAVPRAFENYGIQQDALSTQMRRMNQVLERKADARGITGTDKAELMQTMGEMSLSLLGSTRIQSRSLPRSYVDGASHDFVRNTYDYSTSAGNYIAKLDTKPKVDAALLELADYIKEHNQDGLSEGRTAISNEVVRRIATPNPIAEGKAMNAVSSRILSMSFLSKLMSPSYSVINATQPMMTTAPYLAGQYGAGKAYSHMVRAYRDIQALKSVGEGLKDTGRKFNPNNTDIPTDPTSLIMQRLTNPKERELFNIAIENGVIDTDSGLEVSKLVKDQRGIVGKLDTGVGYLEGIARQMPKSIEAINRGVSLLASYRLEMDRSGNHERAVQFAQDTVNMTQFNYSKSNSAPYMNHPALRLALQFKKYGAGMYQMLGEQVALAVRNENPGDRARAIKSLSYTIGTHVLMAGAMGLPTEPIKMVVLAANGLGITDWGWGDVMDAQREAAAEVFGKDFGEIISRGLPHAVGIDLSSRMGIDTLMGPFGEPRSNEAQDWKAYAWDTVSGAPAGLVTDWARGINDLAQGDFSHAAQRLVPIKAFSDSVKAYRTYTEGTVSEKTGKQVMSPYTPAEAIARAVGFTPSREAESFERSSSFYRAKTDQDANRMQFQKDWVGATGAGKGRIWQDVQKWNRSQPKEARLSLSDLKGYQKKMATDMKDTKEGIRARGREKHIEKKVDATFNYLP